MIDHPTRPLGDRGEAEPHEGSAAPASPADDPALRLGARFGRFVVLDRLGTGGMGVVVSAYDPALDRKVAIKVVRPGLRGPAARDEAARDEAARDEAARDEAARDEAPGDAAEAALDEARRRMLREAKAMARLAHPNVVTVHEVGVVDDDVFLVMELVDGETLGQWLTRPRPWRDIVATAVAAGRGLAAAHAAGLVHRDFKPHNVLLGRDGRVRVSDFGVVSVAGSAADLAAGTPPYMAPEQHLQLPVDARADQFSFCVTLYEALYGHHPFHGTTAAELRAAICSGAVRAPDDPRDVPSRVHDAVRRGLARGPDSRWPSMDALLAALERDPGRARRRGAAAAGVVALAGLALFGWTRGDAPAPAPACADAEAALRAAWDEPARDAIGRAFAAADPTRGPDAADRVGARLDAYAARWASTLTAVCAARGADDRAATAFHARMACLTGLRDELRGLTGLFAAEADAVVVGGAVAAVADLPPAERCLDAGAAAAAPALAPKRRAELVALRARLDRAATLRRAGLVREALALATELAAAADALGVAATRGEAQLLLGEIRHRAGDGAGAEAALHAAARAGAEAGDDLVVARAWTMLLWVVGRQPGRGDEGLAMAPFAEAAVVRAGAPAAVRAELAFHTAGVLVELGRYDDAVPHLERARGLWAEELDPRHPEAARPLLTLGNVAKYQGRLDEARGYYEQALALREAALGEHHPDLTPALRNLGSLATDQGDPAAALAACGRSLAIEEATFGPASRGRAADLRCLAAAHRLRGDLDRARALLEQAVGLGDDTGAGGAYLYYALAELGDVLVDVGEPGRAIERCDQAAAIFGDDLSPDHPDRAFALTCRGRALTALGDPGAARAALARAVALRERHGAPAGDLAEARLALADALWADRGARPTARALAAQARDGYASVRQAPRVAHVEAWLAARPP